MPILSFQDSWQLIDHLLVYKGALSDLTMLLLADSVLVKETGLLTEPVNVSDLAGEMDSRTELHLHHQLLTQVSTSAGFQDQTQLQTLTSQQDASHLTLQALLGTMPLITVSVTLPMDGPSKLMALETQLAIACLSVYMVDRMMTDQQLLMNVGLPLELVH